MIEILYDRRCGGVEAGAGGLFAAQTLLLVITMSFVLGVDLI